MEGVEGYIVLWNQAKTYRKRGILNWLLGRTVQKLQPMLHRYEDQEVAEYGFDNIKKNGGYQPYLLRIIKE